MKKKITLIGIMMSNFAIAQVGINTPNPSSTLDITAKNALGNATNTDGILIPRIDRQRAQNMTGISTSTMIFVNSIATGTQTGNAVNIDAVGFYYYNGTAWVKLHNPSNSNFVSSNIYTNDGSLSSNRTVTQGANTLAFAGNAVNSFSVDGSTFSVDAANDRVGIGTTAIDASAKFQVDATNKGMLIPRVALTTNTDGTTIANPAKGLIVYNTNVNTTMEEGFYTNYGTPSAPQWITYQKRDKTLWNLVDVFDITATNPVDQTAIPGTTINNVNLGMRVTVTIPAFTQAKLVTTYSVPLGTTAEVPNFGGYYGIRFLKNGSELVLGSRKYTVASGGAQTPLSRMASVNATVGDTVNNNTASPVNITYSLNGYIEPYGTENATIRFNMWSTTDPNFNWGRAYMTVQMFTKPL